jgi:hypothetical protein
VLPLAVSFIDIPIRALGIFSHSIGGRKLLRFVVVERQT